VLRLVSALAAVEVTKISLLSNLLFTNEVFSNLKIPKTIGLEGFLSNSLGGGGGVFIVICFLLKEILLCYLLMFVKELPV
jgi:thiosulfate reductase cytochrome b subunit